MTSGDTSQKVVKPGSPSDIWGFLDKLSGLVEPEVFGQGFSLQLGDGSRWWITGSGLAFSIAEQLATIMQLKQGNLGEENSQDDRFICFYEKNADFCGLETLFSQDPGWINLKKGFSQIHYHAKLHHILGEYDSTIPKNSSYFLMWGAVPSIYRESIHRGGLPFHATLLEYQGRGVILAAPGNTGKSTCSRRVVYPWQARCDDEVLVVLTPTGRYLAHPFPTMTDYVWERAENTWKVEDAVPLAGIFFFEQSAQDGFVPLEGAQTAAAAIYSAEQAMSRHLWWCDAGDARALRRAMFANACEIVKQVPAFRLRVSLHGTFWEQIEAALGWR